MLEKYLNKTTEELVELSAKWERSERLRVWNSKPRETQEQIDEFYINMPDGYMADIERVAQKEKAGRLANIGMVKGLKVLDFGCGTGVYGLELLRKGAEVDFYDLPTRAFEFVKQRVAEEGLKAGFYNTLEELPAQYDIIICIDVLEHVKHPVDIFNMLHGKLKNFGKMVLESPLLRAVPEQIDITKLADGEHIEEAVKDWFGLKGNAVINRWYVQNGNVFTKTDLRILLLYNYSPGTTGDFIERALRKVAKVFTNRDFKIQVNGEGIRSVVEELKINVVLQIDSGGWIRIPKLDGVLKVAYSIDTFTAPEKIKQDILYPYDVKLYAQKKFAQEKNEYWVPLAADPEVYRHIECILKYDVGFCGTFITKRSQAKRNACLKALTNEFMKGPGVMGIELYVGRDYNEYAGLRYNESRMVFNMGINDDINMRFFEAAAAGVPQFYTEVDGLKELGFEPDVHYIRFTDEKDITKALYLTLNNFEKATAIRAAAHKLVLEKHTYTHRIAQIIDILKKYLYK